MTMMRDTTIDSTETPIARFAATLDPSWSAAELATSGTPLAELGHLRHGQPIVSAAGFEIGLLDGVVVDSADTSRATHLVLQPGHRFGSRDLILPTPRVRFDAVPLRVVLSRAAIDDLPPASIERIAPPTPRMVNGDRARRRRIIRLCTPGPHRRTSIPMCERAAEPVRPALVAV